MNVLVIPDLHAPYAHPRALAFIKRLLARYSPDAVVCIGDLGDGHGWGRWPREPDAPGQGDEDRECLRFLRRLYALCPVVKACVGNHDARLAKTCARAGIPSRLHRTVSEIYESPGGWEWADRHMIDGVCYTHGDGFGGKDAAMKAAQSHRCPTVIGHVHTNAGVTYSAGPYDVIWGMGVGCLIDPDSLAFTYARKNSARPVLGAGVVLDGVPHFIPLE